LDANVQMIDIVEILILNNDLNNLIRISNDHEDHYNHLKKYQYVFHKNNLIKKSKKIFEKKRILFLIYLQYDLVMKNVS